MLLEQFRTNFPPDSEIPALLIQLLDYQNMSTDWYSGRFELTGYGAHDTVAWFDGDAEVAAQFVPFGAGPDGSSYCYWLYPGRSLATAPIVFLGSEGVGCTVLTNTAEEFLALLAIGYKELGLPIGTRVSLKPHTCCNSDHGCKLSLGFIRHGAVPR